MWIVRNGGRGGNSESDKEERKAKQEERRKRRGKKGEIEKKEVTRWQKWKNLSAKFSSSPERETEKESNVVHKRPFCCFSAH